MICLRFIFDIRLDYLYYIIEWRSVFMFLDFFDIYIVNGFWRGDNDCLYGYVFVSNYD